MAEEEAFSWRPIWEFLVVILGAIATLELTGLLPLLYWPGVVIVYIGLVGMIVDEVRGKGRHHIIWRVAISALGIVGLVWWTGWVVCARVPVIVDAKLGMDGAVRLYLGNQSRYDLERGDFEVSVDGMIVDVAQLAEVCQGFSYFPEDRPVFIGTSAGSLFPAGKSMANRGRILCEKLPHTSVVTFVIPVFTTDIGRNPQHPFPQNAHSNRPPLWFKIKGEYRAVGKTREFEKEFRFPN